MYEQHAHQMVDKVEATNINNSQTNTYIFMLRGQDISIYFHLSSAFFCPPFINFSNVGTLVLKNCHMRLVYQERSRQFCWDV